MIKVGNDWIIGTDPRNYMVARNRPRERNRNGATQVVYLFEAYFHTLEDALEYIRQEMIRDRLSGEDMTLADAIWAIRETNAKFRRLIEEVEK